MATEHVERELRRRLRDLLGDVAAMALIEKFPPDGRVEALRDEMHESFEEVWERFRRVDARFDQVDARFEQVDARFEQVERHLERIDSRFEVLEHRLTAAFRGELNAAITAQTRTVMFSMLGSIVSVGAIAVTLQQLG